MSLNWGFFLSQSHTFGHIPFGILTASHEYCTGGSRRVPPLIGKRSTDGEVPTSSRAELQPFSEMGPQSTLNTPLCVVKCLLNKQSPRWACHFSEARPWSEWLEFDLTFVYYRRDRTVRHRWPSCSGGFPVDGRWTRLVMGGTSGPFGGDCTNVYVPFAADWEDAGTWTVQLAPCVQWRNIRRCLYYDRSAGAIHSMMRRNISSVQDNALNIDKQNLCATRYNQLKD